MDVERPSVAIVHSEYLSGASGENLAVQLQAEALARRGFKVSLILRRAKSQRLGLESFVKGLSVISGFGPSPIRTITAIRPHVVHVHNLYPNWGSTWLDSIEVPVVGTLHNFRHLCASATLSRDGKKCELCPKAGSHNAVKHACYRGSRIASIPLAVATNQPNRNILLNRAEILVALSTTSHRAFSKFLDPEIMDKFRVIPNFAESPRRPYRHETPQDHFLFAGRLSPEKGLKELLSIWPASAKLRVAGDGPEMEECVKRARGKGVEFLGQLSRSEVKKEMSEATGLVFPSTCLEGGLPFAYLDALSVGLPVLALRGNAVGEHVREFRTGQSYQDQASLQESLLDAHKWGPSVSRRAKKIYAELFSEEAWITSMSAVYQEAMALREAR